MTDSGKEVRAQLLKSTTIIGGSSVINVVFKIIQAKAAAVLLGPSGVGLMGLYNAASGMAASVAGMGLNTSGVRQIADAAASGDSQRIARKIKALRRTALVFGFIGAVAFFIFRRPIAVATFGNDEHATALGILALLPLLAVVAGAETALIRGMRRIGDVARVSVYGAALGAICGIPVLYFWRERGVAPYLVVVAGTALLVSWRYARRIRGAKGPLENNLSTPGIWRTAAGYSKGKGIDKEIVM